MRLRMISLLSLRDPWSEVSYHWERQMGVSLRAGLSAERKPRWIFSLTGIHP